MSPLLEVKNISVTYPNGHRAVDDVSFSLSKGKICGLVGVNGSGKSTIFKTLMGFIKPQSGSVSISQYPIKKALKKNLVSYVPQSEDVDWDFPVLVEDVVMMGRYGHMGFLRRPSEKDREEVSLALEKVDLLSLRKRQIGELSGGQKKRVFVARALAQGSEIFLLDEPFTGVDIKTENSLVELFHRLSREGKLILISTHNLGSVPHFCDEVILVNKKILAFGLTEEVFTQENLLKAFGGKLRHLHIQGGELHDDEDHREVTVISDDESPLVFYGEREKQAIIRRKAQAKKGED